MSRRAKAREWVEVTCVHRRLARASRIHVISSRRDLTAKTASEGQQMQWHHSKAHKETFLGWQCGSKRTAGEVRSGGGSRRSSSPILRQCCGAELSQELWQSPITRERCLGWPLASLLMEQHRGTASPAPLQCRSSKTAEWRYSARLTDTAHTCRAVPKITAVLVPSTRSLAVEAPATALPGALVAGPSPLVPLIGGRATVACSGL